MKPLMNAALSELRQNAVKTAIRQWAYVQANNRWQNIKTCRQAKLIIQGYSSGIDSCIRRRHSGAILRHFYSLLLTELR